MKYTIQKGDTLFSVAEAYLGYGNAWPKLWRLNKAKLVQEQRRRLPKGSQRIGSPHWVFPGTEIEIVR